MFSRFSSLLGTLPALVSIDPQSWWTARNMALCIIVCRCRCCCLWQGAHSPIYKGGGAGAGLTTPSRLQGAQIGWLRRGRGRGRLRPAAVTVAPQGRVWKRGHCWRLRLVVVRTRAEHGRRPGQCGSRPSFGRGVAAGLRGRLCLRSWLPAGWGRTSSLPCTPRVLSRTPKEMSIPCRERLLDANHSAIAAFRIKVTPSQGNPQLFLWDSI